MKTFRLLIILCSSTAIAQSDSISSYFGVYTSTDKSATYLFTEGLNHTVSMEFLWMTDKNPDNVDDGRVGRPSKGRYPMTITDPLTSKRVYYWIDFKTDTGGKKSAVISSKTEAIDTLLFSDDQSWYQQYIDYMNDESDETDSPEETDGEYTITGYQREDGAILILDFADQNSIKLTLIGAPDESCPDANSIEGILKQTDENNYSFRTGDCTIQVVIEAKQVSITEEQCSKLHPKSCKKWEGVYQIDM